MAEAEKPAQAAPSGFGPVGGWGAAGGPPTGGFGFGPMPPMMPFRGRGRGWRGRGWRGRGWRGRGRGRGRGAGPQTMHVDVTNNMGDVTPLDDDTRSKLNDICTSLMEICTKAGPTDKQRVNSALAHLRKIGTPSARIVDITQTVPQYKRGVQLDRPGVEKMKEALLIMKALVKDLPDEHEKHRVVAEHVVSNLTKLVKQNCTYSGTEEMEYDGSSDGLARARAAKKLLQDMDSEDLLSEKELRNFNATVNTVQAFISRVTDRNYRPAKVKWLLENSATYENPDWKPTGRRSSRRSPPRERRDRSRERRRRRRRSRSRD